MPATLRSNKAEVVRSIREDAAERLNSARDASMERGRSGAVPVATGNLLSTLEGLPDATPERLSTGFRIGGERAPYAQAVNDGHMTRSGGFVSGHHFVEQMEAAGREALHGG